MLFRSGSGTLCSGPRRHSLNAQNFLPGTHWIPGRFSIGTKNRPSRTRLRVLFSSGQSYLVFANTEPSLCSGKKEFREPGPGAPFCLRGRQFADISVCTLAACQIIR